ncbi:MAG TPA: hypothetical protein VGM82_22285 [Gemmatimonadaceae bacterium]
MNRLTEFLREPREPPKVRDFYEVHTAQEYFVVTRKTAMEVERQLDEVPARRWVTFRDLLGARHRVLLSTITRMSENGATHRAAMRQFLRDRSEERGDDSNE